MCISLRSFYMDHKKGYTKAGLFLQELSFAFLFTPVIMNVVLSIYVGHFSSKVYCFSKTIAVVNSILHCFIRIHSHVPGYAILFEAEIFTQKLVRLIQSRIYTAIFNKFKDYQ